MRLATQTATAAAALTLANMPAQGQVLNFFTKSSKEAAETLAVNHQEEKAVDCPLMVEEDPWKERKPYQQDLEQEVAATAY